MRLKKVMRLLFYAWMKIPILMWFQQFKKINCFAAYLCTQISYFIVHFVQLFSSFHFAGLKFVLYNAFGSKSVTSWHFSKISLKCNFSVLDNFQHILKCRVFCSFFRVQTSSPQTRCFCGNLGVEIYNIVRSRSDWITTSFFSNTLKKIVLLTIFIHFCDDGVQGFFLDS